MFDIASLLWLYKPVSDLDQITISFIIISIPSKISMEVFLEQVTAFVQHNFLQ